MSTNTSKSSIGSKYMLLTQEITISILCHQSCATTLTRKISYQVTSHRRSYKISLYIYIREIKECRHKHRRHPHYSCIKITWLAIYKLQISTTKMTNCNISHHCVCVMYKHIYMSPLYIFNNVLG